MAKPAIIPLGTQAYRRDLGFVPEVECVNLLIEKDESGAAPDGVLRVQRPGLTRFATLPNAIQGMFEQDGVLKGARFAVAGNTLYSYTSTTRATIGGVGPGRAVFAATYAALYVLSAGQLYSYDGSTFAQVAMPDNRVIADIETLNSYVVMVCPDGRLYWLVPGDTTVDPLNFATAESAPDGLRAIKRLVDEVWLFGASTIEPWQATGDADAPFQRAAGRVLDRGCASRDTVLRFDNGLLWEGDDGLIYRSGAVPQRVSTTGIEERIRQATDMRSAWAFSVEGHKCYVLAVPGQGSYAYDAASQEWTQMATIGATLWDAQLGDGSLAGSGVAGAIWTVDQSAATDDGAPFRKAATGTIGLRGLPQRNANASFSVGASDTTEFRIRWRDSDEDFGDWEAFEVTGAEVFTLYRMGQGRQPYRTFEIETTDPTQVRMDGATVNSGWQ